MSLHSEPQKHIGTWIPSGTVALILFHGMYDEPEDAMVGLCSGAVLCASVPFECWVSLFVDGRRWCMGIVQGHYESSFIISRRVVVAV